MASLAELYGTAKSKARQIPANLRESGKGLASWAVDPYGEAQRVMGEYRNMTPEQRQGLVNAAVDLFGGIDVGPVGAIKASHGSPHAFTAFDFSKMGTGEGAQAYGHGGYFAHGFDSPVAKSYARKHLTGPANVAHVAAKSPLNALETLKMIYPNRSNDFYESAIKDAEIPGHFYNVELRWPDPAREAVDPLGEHHLLDWDAPLNKQTEYVRTAFNMADAKRGLLRNYSKILDPEDKWTRGGDAYRDLASALNDSVTRRGSTALDDSDKIVSNYLRSFGIPGIRYLDQSSRGQGIGTRNYVMFDDRFPNIVTRNGVSITDLLKNR